MERFPPALLCGLSFALSAYAQAPPDAEHRAVLEIGGLAAVALADGSSRFGGSVAVEKTVVENWLELELGLSTVSGKGETELSGSLLFKKPWQLSERVEFMIGAGPELSHSLEAGGGTSPGIVAVLDFMFWPSRNVGWYLEPGYEIVFRHGAQHAINVVGGLLIGF